MQIVESWREGGDADKQELAHLKSLVELIKAKIEEQIQPALFSPEELAKLIHQGRQCKQQSQAKVVISDLRGEQVVTLSIHDVYGEFYGQPYRATINTIDRAIRRWELTKQPEWHL